MKRKNLGIVRPANGFYDKLNALMFVPQKELSGDQAYWLSANEIASQASKSATPGTPFVRKSRPPQAPSYGQSEKTSNRPTQKPPVQQNKKPNVPVNLSTRTKMRHESTAKPSQRATHSKPSVSGPNKLVWKATRNHNVNTTKTAWRPTRKVVGSVKPQWKPTGRHFALSNGHTVADSIGERLKTYQPLQVQDRLQYHSCLGILKVLFQIAQLDIGAISPHSSYFEVGD
ncbi:hypothetical protein Tco_1318944 [Tanacetum coccineum]